MPGFFVGKDGPVPCRAKDITQCPYHKGGSHFESKNDANTHWEKELEKNKQSSNVTVAHHTRKQEQ